MNQNGTESEQALLVNIKILDMSVELSAARAQILVLENELEEIINEHKVGEFDGDEWGHNDCTLYMYGESADRLFGTVITILKEFSKKTKIRIVKRYGKPGSAEEAVVLS